MTWGLPLRSLITARKVRVRLGLASASEVKAEARGGHGLMLHSALFHANAAHHRCSSTQSAPCPSPIAREALVIHRAQLEGLGLGEGVLSMSATREVGRRRE